MRKPIIAGNWKMHKTVTEAVELVKGLVAANKNVKDVEMVVCPPFTALYAAKQALAGSDIKLGAQNVFWEEKGAFTGEIAPQMLKEIGCDYVIIGHSERRQYFGETDETVNKRIKAALKAGLKPIFCVGETLEEREANKTEAVIAVQMRGGLAGLTAAEMDQIVVAYEPVWAIGTGRTASAADANAVCAYCRKLVQELFGADCAAATRVQYGGSVKGENAAELMAMSDIDGALVGGAALDAAGFTKIIQYK